MLHRNAFLFKDIGKDIGKDTLTNMLFLAIK